MHDRRARYVDNFDGDSIIMMLDQDFHDTKTINIRLANVWAPEIKQDGGVAVWRYVNDWCLDVISKSDGGWPFLVVTHRTRTDKEKMSLGRYVADVLTIDGKRHLNSDVMRFIVMNNYDGGIGSIVRPADGTNR